MEPDIERMSGDALVHIEEITPAALAEHVAASFGALPQVIAVAVAGSRTTGAADDLSDTDLYVYAEEPLVLEDRAAIATSFAAKPEMGNAFWEPGDEWIDFRTGRQIDVMYRAPIWIENQIERVLVHYEASVGYSTCFWHNVLHSEPLFDPTGWYRNLQSSATRPYPEPLRRAIVAKNHPILRQTLSSYLAQIERAVSREDSVSVQHRVTALLASYFDILFAVNELPHPGEKRVLQVAMARCSRLAPGMEAQVNALLEMVAHPATPLIVTRITMLLDGLDELLLDEGLLSRDVASAGSAPPVEAESRQ